MDRVRVWISVLCQLLQNCPNMVKMLFCGGSGEAKGPVSSSRQDRNIF